MQFDLGTIDPTETSGFELADLLNQWKVSVHSNHSGDDRPTYAIDNMAWMDTSGSEVVWKYYDQLNDADIEIGRFVTTSGTFRPANVDPESFATSTATTVNATDADSNRVVVFTAAAGLNLPVPAGVRDSWKIKVVAVGGNVTVDAPSPALVDGESSLVVQEGTSTTIYIVGDNYFTDLNFKFSSGGVPVGTIVYFSVTTAPDGFLICDGTAVTDLYPDLKALLVAAGNPFGTTGGNPLRPDLRGEFMRGWDGGRGVDTGRVFGSAQLDQMQGHRHNPLSGATAFWVNAPGGTMGSTGYNFTGNGTTGDPVTDGANGNPRVGLETRPRNVAMLPCIKAFGAVSPEGMADLAALLTAIATQAEAEAGTNNTKIMTPQRTMQAVAAYNRWKKIASVRTSGSVFVHTDLGAYRRILMSGSIRSVSTLGYPFLNFSSNNGSSWLTTNYTVGYLYNTAGNVVGGQLVTTSAGVAFLGGGNNLNATRYSRFELDISEFNIAFPTSFYAPYFAITDTTIIGGQMSGHHIDGTAMNALRFNCTQLMDADYEIEGLVT